MLYTTYDDLARTIRQNVWKVPADVDLIVGIPRSGMIAALMLAELMHKRVADLDTFLQGGTMACGGRGGLIPPSPYTTKVLILDDTCYRGNSMTKTKERLKFLSSYYTFIYACVYTDGADAKRFVDIYFDDIAGKGGDGLVLYEWNAFHHYPDIMLKTMWDIDGLMCREPPEDSNRDAYEAYLPEAIPMVLPTTTVGAVVTYRLEKYRAVTEEWLRRHGVTYRQLVMFPANDARDRNATCSPEMWKAGIYRDAEWAQLFYESSDWQAQMIQELSGKPVLAYDSGRAYPQPLPKGKGERA